MQPDIKLIMRHLMAQESGVTEATVWIEKPLNSGLQLEAQLIVHGKPKYVVVNNDEEFFAYTQSYKGKGRWNRMVVKMNDKGEVDTSVSFDVDFQKKVEEITK